MKSYLREQVLSGLHAVGLTVLPSLTFEQPRVPEHGDLTTNIAMIVAKREGTNPRELARRIVEAMKIDTTLVDRVEIAGPGFINFHFTVKFYLQRLADILRQAENFGRSKAGDGKKTQVEFVSANPTGPLTVGHGRGAVFGDTISRLLEWTDHVVTREYYFNNAGRQMRILGDSVRLRYLELLGDHITFPEDYYQGEYIKAIARQLHEQHGDSLRKEPAEGSFKRRAEEEIFGEIKNTCRRMGIVFDVFYNENTLYESGKVKEVIEDFRKKDLAYDRDGAVWLRTSALGGEKDKVIVKSTGEPTYRLPDIAYHREKLRRGFELIIDVLGADHIAAYPDVLSGLGALGEDTSRIKVLIHQFVTIVQGGAVVKMSTRKANFVTLDELIDEVGADVVRYFFLMRGANTHLNFDLGLAKQQSEENPVYYLQYAYARIASIIRNAESLRMSPAAAAHYELLNVPEEINLLKRLTCFPDTVESCAVTLEPHRLGEYLQEIAGCFHKFYQACRVLGDDPDLTSARIALCGATKIVLANGFSILGVSAPEKM